MSFTGYEQMHNIPYTWLQYKDRTKVATVEDWRTKRQQREAQPGRGGSEMASTQQSVQGAGGPILGESFEAG